MGHLKLRNGSKCHIHICHLTAQSSTSSTNLGAAIKERDTLVQISNSVCYRFEDSTHASTRNAIWKVGGRRPGAQNMMDNG